MTESFEAAVRAACETELDRLSGDKVLLAATGATLEREAVLGALRRSLRRAAEQSEAWAGASGETVAAPMTTAAERFAAADAAVADEAAADPPAGTTVLSLGEPATPLERAGACCVGASLLLDGLALQGVSFFVNEADAGRADRCRATRDTLDELRAEATTALADRCGDATDEEAVVDGAVGAVEASYGTYVAVLEEMGLDPKPIC